MMKTMIGEIFKRFYSFVYGKAPNFNEYKDEIFNIILNKK